MRMEMKEKGLSPDLISFNAIMHILKQKGSEEEILKAIYISQFIN
jgi:hypothetical protein